MTSKERFMAVLNNKKPDITPVFPLIMGFAAAQSGFTYRQYASNGSCLAQAQVFTADKFGFDAVTSCSDAFRIAADLGGEIVYYDDTPPRITEPIIKSFDDFDKIKTNKIPDNGRCSDRVKAVSEMVKAAGERLFILGWVDFPFAEACSCCGVQEFMYMMADEPELAHSILRFLTDLVKDFALRQLDAGAPMIGCGDAAASLVSPEMFTEFALPYEREVVEAIHLRGGLVKTHICGNTIKTLNLILQNESDLFNVDHMVKLEDAIKVYGSASKAVKGNLDPVTDILQADPKRTYELAKRCISISAGYKYILSAGCEIPTQTRDENVHALKAAANDMP